MQKRLSETKFFRQPLFSLQCFIFFVFFVFVDKKKLNVILL